MMSVKLTWNFTSLYGKGVADGILANQAALKCSCPDEVCDVKVEELPEQRVQVTVTRARPTVDCGDWAVVGLNRNQYSKTFERPSADELTDSITRLIEARLVKVAISTIDEFLVELGRIRDQFDWKLQPDDRWLSDRRSWLRFRVRGSSRKGPAEGIGLDPIGAVCYANTRKLYEPDYWEDAVKTLGLPLAIASDLMAAANDRTWKGIEGKRRPYEPLESLRRRLVKTIGLRLPSP